MNIKRNIAFQTHVRMIAESECRTPEITIKIINDFAEQESFQNKVINLLKRNEDCINPLKELSDNKLLNVMTDIEKQKYMLELSEKYNRVRADYIKSKQASL